jgi:hypothetical protein
MRYAAFAILMLSACSDDTPKSSKTEPDSIRPNTTAFTRAPGGSVTTTLGYGIKLNPNSSLQREWITGHDSLAPVDLSGTVGVNTVYKPSQGYSSGEYRYEASVPLVVREDISAFEVRVVLFDVWGAFTKTLSYTEIEDVPKGTTKIFTPSWRVYDENEVSEHYASIAYVALVRTKQGRVFEADFQPIVTEAKKLSARFEPSWLDPNRRVSPDSAKVSK